MSLHEEAKTETDFEKEFRDELSTIERLRSLLEIDENDLIVGGALLRYLRRCVDAGRPNDEKQMTIELAAFLAGWNAAIDASEKED